MILTAIIRSLVQWGFTKLLAAPVVINAVAFINEELGLTFDLNDYRGWAEAFLFAVVMALTGWLGQHPSIGPVLNKVISLGRAATGPAYAPKVPAEAAVQPTPDAGPIVAVITDPEEPRHLKP